VAGIIPARFASTRLPGKPLREIAGKTLIERVYERCRLAPRLDLVCVATDDERIASAVRAFDGQVIMTSSAHRSGTDRLAEAVATMDVQLVVNIQGDQPFLDPRMIEEAVQPVLADSSVEICTLMHPVANPEHWKDPAVVKVVTDRQGNALYFSRSRIPFPQTSLEHTVYEHVGLYVYRKAILLELARLTPTILEQVESLEQLRWLEHGKRIRVVQTHCVDHEFSGFSVDTVDDLDRANQLARERQLHS
jgi:3-deoxy-manno-octulosonate cytidylyltransferase (CMP-KDO synthetase)